MATLEKQPILLVDDEPDVLFSLKGLLRRDFELYTAESGDEALEILRQHDIHVIMTDQRMPGMTGVELMKLAKAEFPAAVRIVFTGYADIKAVVDAINSGDLYRYVTKPWDPDDLIALLHEAANQYESVAAQLQLSSDLKTFIVDTLQFAEGLRESHPEAEQLIEQGNAISRRLEEMF